MNMRADHGLVITSAERQTRVWRLLLKCKGAARLLVTGPHLVMQSLREKGLTIKRFRNRTGAAMLVFSGGA
jgi:hypothetical protein